MCPQFGGWSPRSRSVPFPGLGPLHGLWTVPSHHVLTCPGESRHSGISSSKGTDAISRAQRYDLIRPLSPPKGPSSKHHHISGRWGEGFHMDIWEGHRHHIPTKGFPSIPPPWSIPLVSRLKGALPDRHASVSQDRTGLSEEPLIYSPESSRMSAQRHIRGSSPHWRLWS